MSENLKREGAPRLLTVPEIVEKHGISRQTIHAYRQRGTFPQPAPEQGGSTRLRFREDEVDAFIAANPKRPGRRPRTDPETTPEGEPMTTEQAPKISEPVATNDRGFLIYGGQPIPTSYGHTVRVQESSAADGPHVWLFVDDSPTAPKGSPHLDLEQAIAVHAALGQFIDSVAERWEGGEEMVAEAKRNVLGEQS